ncbi:hypothetical protein VTK56DRAFT_7195 [Thermocarpiscus australiensis]
MTFVDTAPVIGHGLEVDGIQYQRSYRDVPGALTYLGDYHEVLTFLSQWSGISYRIAYQRDFFSHPTMPQLIRYLVVNHRTLGRQLSPKHDTLALRAACPVTGCHLAEKHGRLNSYTIHNPYAIPPTTKATTESPIATPAMITFNCPRHGPHTVSLADPRSVARLEANAPARNLVRSMLHLLDTQIHHIRITGADYAGTYQEAMLYRPLAEWSWWWWRTRTGVAPSASASTSTSSTTGAGRDKSSPNPQVRTPHILYAPLVTDWSGAKLSKSMYVREGGYEGMTRFFGTGALASWRALGEQVGKEEGLRRVWGEVGRWVADPRRLFRCFSVEYLLRVVVEGRAWED